MPTDLDDLEYAALQLEKYVSEPCACTVREAIAELSANHAAAVGADVGAGWVLVPPEPTEAMEAAYERAHSQKMQDIYSPTPTEHYEDGGGAFGYGYRAMLKAAPAVGVNVGVNVSSPEAVADTSRA